MTSAAPTDPTNWSALRSSRIFVTGGTGFFGACLLERYHEARVREGLTAELVLLSRDPDAFARKHPDLASIPGVSLARGDVRAFRDADVPAGEFTHLIHAATSASAKLNEESPLEMIDSIVAGTRRALDFARARGVRRMLFTSSGAVYGPQPAELTHIPEDFGGGPDPLSPASAYGEGKRLAELLCAVEASGRGDATRAGRANRAAPLEIAIGRFFAFVGPHLPLDTHFAIGNFIRDALAGVPIRVGGDGTPYRSYLYGSELGSALWTMLARAPSLRAFNIGSEERVSIAELAHAVSRALEPLTGRRAEVIIAKKPEPGRAPAQYVPSTRRAREELGLVQRIGLDEAIRRTAEWALARPHFPL